MMNLFHWFRRRPNPSLEQQLKALADLGLPLNPGITVDDLLLSWDRDEYEKNPYDIVLHMLGSEVESKPWGRNICDRAWNFDVECIEDTGDYVRIVSRLCKVAGMPDLISDAVDFVDIENETAWLTYMIDGEARKHEIEVDNDWADSLTVTKIMQEIERDGKRFYAKDNGQASIWFYLDERTANTLNRLTHNALRLGS